MTGGVVPLSDVRERRWKFDGLPDLVYEYPLQPKRYCTRCGRPLYKVQSPDGEVFLVAHDGTRWCTA